MVIELGDLSDDDVQALLTRHLALMHASSPACSIHALDLDALRAPDITFWTIRDGDALLGCGALKELDPAHGEIKSMHTAEPARGKGVAARLVGHILAEAARRSDRRVSLETGSQAVFEPARALYRRSGFTDCAPFAGYGPDPNSVFMTRQID